MVNPLELARRVLMETIKIPSVSPSGRHYREIVDVYREFMKEAGLKVSVYQVPQELVERKVPSEGRKNPRYIVIGSVGSGRPILHFNGHYDVVPGGSGWTVTDPFDPVEKDGAIYGRGATDMKGGIAAVIGALSKVADEVEKLGGRVELALVPDEEIGGETGTGYLLDSGISKPDYVIIAEPSTLNRIYIGHKGAIWADIVVRGKAAHGSVPWMGVNAFEKMVYVAKRFIEEYKPAVESKRSSYEYDVPEGAKATVNLGGKIASTGKTNVVPDVASFSIDRRLIIEESVDEAVKELEEFVKKLKLEDPSLDLEVNIRSAMKPVATGEDTLLTRIVKEAGRRVLGAEPKPIVCVGGLDMRYYIEHGIETVAYGPGTLGTAHAANEYIKIKDLERAIAIYEAIVVDVLSSSNER